MTEAIDPHIRKRAAMEDTTRDLAYPPAPEALVVPVYDNHTHLEIADGENPLHYREHLDRASAVGVRGLGSGADAGGAAQGGDFRQLAASNIARRDNFSESVENADRLAQGQGFELAG